MSATWDSKTRPHFVLGLNAATRALEQAQLSALILNSSADPPRLLHGLIRLARSKHTPVLCVSQLQEWVPGLSSLLALGLRRTAPTSKSVDAFLTAVVQSAPCDLDSTTDPKDENENSRDTSTDTAATASESKATGPAIEAKNTQDESCSAPSTAEAALASRLESERLCEVQGQKKLSLFHVMKEERIAPVSVDIQLSECGVLGFPDYERLYDSLPEVIELTLAPASQKAKPVTVLSAHKASCFVKANIKQVIPKGKLKAKKKRTAQKDC
uniref:Ribosomal protein L7Ae/L30e/S12e/Gadd45 domain-containing protein n=1 Tax=Amblyomma maculatum TaxID=34609 RepID=G3MKJ5_AMBMU